MLTTFGAALFQGLASPGGRGYVTYIAVWPEPADGFGSETLRYLTVAVIGIVIGALAATVSYLTGARAAPAGSRVGLTVTAGLVGITLGLAPVLAMLTVTDYPDVSPLLIYGVCGVGGAPPSVCVEQHRISPRLHGGHSCRHRWHPRRGDLEFADELTLGREQIRHSVYSAQKVTSSRTWPRVCARRGRDRPGAEGRRG
ncbi:hypothetical protein [Gordonia sp. NPDC003950]